MADVSHSDESSESSTVSTETEGFASKSIHFLEDHWKLILGMIVVGLIIVLLAGVINSPFFDMLNSLFDGITSLFSNFTSQMDDCTKNSTNFIDPTSGCILALPALGALVFGAAYGIKRLVSKNSQSEDALEAATGKTTATIGAETISDMKKQGIKSNEDMANILKIKNGGRNPTTSELKAAFSKTASNIMEAKEIAANNTNLTPEKRAAANQAATDRYKAERDVIDKNRDLTEEQKKETDDAAKEISDKIK